MTLPFALGLALEGSRRLGPARTWRERLLRLNEPAGGLAALGAVATALIWIGVILSYSRSGLAVALTATGFFLFVATGRGRRRLPRLLPLALVLPTLLLLWQDVRSPGETFLEREQVLTLSGRLPVWRATLRMVGDHPVLGVGLGTFEVGFLRYRPPSDLNWAHAHNDWLQALVEGGPLLAASMALLLWLVLRPRRAGPRFGGPGFLLHTGIQAAVLAIALHSFTDFCLRIPAHAVLLACLVGCSRVEDGVSSPTLSF